MSTWSRVTLTAALDESSVRLMQLFVTSHYRTSRTRCDRCRDQTVIGEQWRATTALVLELPENKRDFDCLFGVRWRFKPLPVVTIEGTTSEIERAKALVDAVDRRQIAELRSMLKVNMADAQPGALTESCLRNPQSRFGHNAGGIVDGRSVLCERPTPRIRQVPILLNPLEIFPAPDHHSVRRQLVIARSGVSEPKDASGYARKLKNCCKSLPGR